MKALLFAESGALAEEPGPVRASTLLVTRSFPAPQEILFRAWTVATALAQWWGEPGRALVRTLAVRAGGGIHLETSRPGACLTSEVGTFREVTPPDQLVFTLSSEQAGESGRDEVLYTVTFAAHESETQAVLQGRWLHTGMAANAVMAQREAWERRLDRLDAFIAGLKSPSAQGKTISAATNK